MNFIGIDLAWTYNNETGICILNDQGYIELLDSKILNDQELAQIVLQYSKHGAIVAIDAPLVVNNQDKSRTCDPQLMRDTFHGKHLSLFNCSRNYLLKTYGSIRGEDLVKSIQDIEPKFSLTTQLSSTKHGIIEVFPSGIMLALFPEHYPVRYKKKKGLDNLFVQSELNRTIEILCSLSKSSSPVHNVAEYLQPITSEADTRRKPQKHLEDKIDAFLCAYSSYWCYSNNYKVYGDTSDGFIIMPDIPFRRIEFPMKYHMRRQDRKLKKREEIDEILNKGKFVVLSLCKDNEPYIVTLSYGYDQSQNCLYLHCANEGTKLDFIRRNSSVCATVIIDNGYIANECGHAYETVVLRGNLEFVNTLEEKRRGVETIMHHLEVNPKPIMEKTLKTDDVYKTITVLKLVLSDITGKRGR